LTPRVQNAGQGILPVPPRVNIAMKDHKYFVYIISSRSGTLYIGMTNSIYRRALQHKSGEIEGFASKYHCNRLVYSKASTNLMKPKQVRPHDVFPIPWKFERMPQGCSKTLSCGGVLRFAQDDRNPDQRHARRDPTPIKRYFVRNAKKFSKPHPRSLAASLA